MTTYTRPDGATIYGPGTLSHDRLQHELHLRRRATAVPAKRRHSGKGSRSQQRRAAADHG